MKRFIPHFCLALFSIILTACTSTLNPFVQEQKTTVDTTIPSSGTPHVPENKVSDQPIGGFIQSSMDENDKSKLWHALDNAVGKSSHWTNANTNIEYTVMPTKKVTVAGNPFCRKYIITAIKGDKKDQVNGTACVGDDSNWKPVTE